jgi:hypothetical protein
LSLLKLIQGVLYFLVLYFSDKKLDEVVSWIKSLPFYKLPRQKFDAPILDQCVVKAVEDVLQYHKVSKSVF